MGHERVGFLPKTKRWISIVESVGVFSSMGNNNAPEIAEQTLHNVKSRFLDLKNDQAFLSAFKFLLVLSQHGKEKDIENFFKQRDINLTHSTSLFGLNKEANAWMAKQDGSKEYSAIATKALIETINSWVSKNQAQTNLFNENKGVLNSWEKASTGAGFCEVSRDFFSRFTSHYLSYFLDRTASAKIESLQERNVFSKNIQNHVEEISTHSFETAKIAQSFSAGWYNKHAKDTLPSDTKIKGFVGFVIKKLCDELAREGRQHG